MGKEYAGIDIGSPTTKLVVIDTGGTVRVPPPGTRHPASGGAVQAGVSCRPKKGISLMEKLAAAATAGDYPGPNDPQGNNRKRILLTGVPVGLGSDKVVRLVEQCGADVVAFENCSVYKQAFMVDEEMEPMEALARQYLATPCSVMSLNTGRLELLEQMIEDFAVDGVIDLTWQACHTYNIEAYTVERFVRERFDLPTLHLETDYAESDTEQLWVRIEAYLEMLG